MITPPKNPVLGFTLLEILVALVIFGLMSVISFRGLSSVAQSRAHLAQENRKWGEVALLFARLEQDLSMLANRPVRDAGNLSTAPLVAKSILQSEYDTQLMFTRMGLPDQANGLAAPTRCGYRLHGETVEQVVWPATDAAPRTVPAVNLLLENVAAMEFTYLDSAGTWHNRWPLPDSDVIFPAAVQVVLELKSRERITRLFAVPVLQ